jgi:hypothetical protein
MKYDLATEAQMRLINLRISGFQFLTNSEGQLSLPKAHYLCAINLFEMESLHFSWSLEWKEGLHLPRSTAIVFSIILINSIYLTQRGEIASSYLLAKTNRHHAICIQNAYRHTPHA